MSEEKKYINKNDALKMKNFYIEIAKLASRLDPNANSTPSARQRLIQNILKVYELVLGQ